MGQMKTPGVYIVENNAFPNSVVEVATAVPAFIGYTEKAENRGNALTNRPWRITSIAEFHQYFGFGPTRDFTRFSLTKVAGAAPAAATGKPLAVRDSVPMTFRKTGYLIAQTRGFYLLYHSMLHFFENGGGPCYIVSVGSYKKDAGINIEAKALTDGLTALEQEQEPTLVVIPEAVLLPKADCDSVQQAALLHCGQTMKNRFAILDIWEGYRDRHAQPDCVAAFRDAIGNHDLGFGAAYYPWVNTTIVQDHDLSYANIDDDSLDALVDGIKQELAGFDMPAATLAQQSAGVDTISPFFASVLGEIRQRLNVLPPSAAMAGVYTMVDNSRGVWKAPANVSLNSVVSPTVTISSEQQEALNVTAQGTSINAIRSFIGEGTLVWGARTLDGNSLDWRYINVRRTMIMLEESIRLASKAFVFEPHVATTWVTMKSMIGNFLTGVWKRGGLAGAAPDDAFSVHVGLGETMTPEDILEGILRVTVLVAISRPAEFLEITFQQQMQKP